MKKNCNNCGKSMLHNNNGSACDGSSYDRCRKARIYTKWVPVRDIRKDDYSGKIIDWETGIVLDIGESTSHKIGDILPDMCVTDSYTRLDYNKYKQYLTREITRYGKFAVGDKVIYQGIETVVVGTKYESFSKSKEGLNVLIQLNKWNGHSGNHMDLDNGKHTRDAGFRNVYWVTDEEITFTKEIKMKYELIKELSLAAVYNYKAEVCSSEFGKIIDRFSKQYDFTQSIKWNESIEAEIIEHSSWVDFLVKNGFLMLVVPRIVYNEDKIYLLDRGCSNSPYKLQKEWQKDLYVWTSAGSTWDVWAHHLSLETGQKAIDYAVGQGTVTEYTNLKEWAKTLKD